MKKILYTILFLCFGLTAQSQNATFITLDNAKNLYKVTVGAGGCTSTPLTFCTNFTGNPLSIALDGNILYVVDNKGFLYKNTLGTNGTAGNCTKLGSFPTAAGSYGLTVGTGGIVYAATGSKIETYNPATSTFATLGTMNTSWTIGGDLLFYQGKLYEAVTVTPGGGNALIEINLANVSASTLYMNFNAGTSVFGFASVTVPCSNNQAYALSSNASTTDIFAVDMTNKTQSTTITCTLPYNVYDAASIAETQSATPPTNPTAATPYSFCQNQTAATITASTNNVKDTLRWYTQATGGTSYGQPTPAINTAIPATTNYYVSNFDTSTGCESGRLQVVVNVIATPPNPTINITTPITHLCAGNSTTFTANTTTGGAAPTYQWYINGGLVSGTSASTFTPTILNNNDTIRCTVTSNAACVLNPNATSNNIVITTLTPTTVPLSFSSCSKVIYLGNSYTTSTNVKDTIKSLQGCDSIIHNVTITIAPNIATTQILNLSGCNNVVYKGNTYTTNTTLKDTIKSLVGCGDSIYYNVNINIAPLIVKNDTINLFDCDSVYYKGTWYNYPTILYDTLKNVQGCDSVNLIVNISVYRKRVLAYITHSLSNCLSVINTQNNTVIKTFYNLKAPKHIQVSSLKNRVYVSCENDSSVTVIDANNNIIIANIKMPDNIDAISISPNDSILYAVLSNAASNGTIFKINTFTNTFVGSLSVGTSNKPNEIAFSSDPTKLFLTTNTGSTGINTCVEVYPITSSSLSLFKYITTGSIPRGLIVSKDGKKAYVANYASNNISVLDMVNYIKIKDIVSSNNPEYLCFNEDESRVYVSNTSSVSNIITVIDTKADTIIKNIITGSVNCQGLSYNKYNKKLYVCNGLGGNVSIINTRTNLLDSTISLGYWNFSIGNFIVESVTPIFQDTLNFSSCSSITYKTKTYTSSTSFTDTTKSYRGCDSVYTLVNIVITNNVAKDTLVKLYSCNKIIYKGITYTSSTTFLDTTIKTISGTCDSIYHYAQVNINPITATTNTQTFTSCKAIIYNGSTYNTSTVLKDTVKSFYGCDSIYNVVNININPITATTNTQTLTSCKAIVYNGSTYTKSTVLKDTVKSFYGCDSIYNVVNINVNPIATTIHTQTFTSCKVIVYSGSTYTTSTVLRDTVKSFQGCDSVYNVVNITIVPVVAITKNASVSGCNAVTYLGYTYTSSTIVKDTIKSFYGCDSIYNNTAINVTPISATVVADTIMGCDSVFYNGVIYTTSTVLQTTIKSYQGCDSIYIIHNISVYTSPKVVGGNPVYVLPNGFVVLHPIVSNASLFNWTPAIYLDDATSENPICTPKKDTTYKIVVTNDNGCKDSSYIKVIVAKQLNIPNVFSPNGDGINDTWVIDGLQPYNQSTVQIFNRWGQKLFSSFMGSYKPWNGLYNGNPLPFGVYYYIIKLSPDTPIISGPITILK